MSDSGAGSGWDPSSWRKFPVTQQPKYKDAAALRDSVEKIRALPPLCTPNEIERLRQQLAEVAEGKRFLLQGGDCAERFADCAPLPIESKLRILLQMSLVLTWGARIPTVRIGRMAGQYSKPRSKDTEVVDGREIPSFRGDNVNGFDCDSRDPDPDRLVQGYFHSAATLNYVRSLLASEFADLRHSADWQLGFVRNSQHKAEFESMVSRILDALDFVRTCGATDDPVFQSVDFFVSHEGLHLDYEEAMTIGFSGAHAGVALDADARARDAPLKHYDTSSHFLWIGDRTRQLDHAHVEFFRGVRNPIGIKVGPSTDAADLVRLIRVLWPDPAAEPGRITLITRLGADKVADLLPPVVRTVKDAGLPVVWCCDPMHGNTHMSEHGLKTRDLDAILREIRITFEVHDKVGTSLGGVHLEMTGENVTECVGGPEALTEEDLPHRYTTYCDPRLNYAQSMEVAFLIAQHLQQQQQHHQGGERVAWSRTFDLDHSPAADAPAAAGGASA